MQEIKCPKCGEVFVANEDGYANIVKQIRDSEFEKEIKRQMESFNMLKEKEIALIKNDQNQNYQKELTKKENELINKDKELEKLKAQLTNLEYQHKLAMSQSDSDKNEIINQLKNELKMADNVKSLAISEVNQDKDKIINNKDNKIKELEALLKVKDYENELKTKSIQTDYENRLKMKDEQIEYYKDFKARQSTKMIGESLEQHCQNVFNSIRMSAFPNAYFEKDNDARSGSKGDFIFRESKDGVEFISIMFEMKNEADTTATKHKNEDFLKELDKDRKEKKCEYAILVSLLEIDNDYYNNGIVDMSYKYEKMYVVRPQFFIPIITLLRNAALESFKYRYQLEVVKNEQIDIMNFEENMKNFKDAFSRNYRIASDKFKLAIDEIDKTILHLQKTKDALISSENNLRLANNKAEDLTIKKLVKNAPSVKKLFEESR